MNGEVNCVEFSSVGCLLDSLIDALNLQHDEYESVKLYGNSSLMVEILRLVFTDAKYSDISIACIDMTCRGIDRVCRDDYILALTDDKELYIQSCWNGDKLFRNEAKFTMCSCDSNIEIIENVLCDNTDVTLYDFV